MKKAIICILWLYFLLYTIQVVGQETECGTDLIHKYRMEQDLSYKNKIETLEIEIQKFIERQSQTKSAQTVYYIPLAVHVIHLGEPVGSGSNFSDTKIQQIIAYINSMYRDAGGYGTDVEIEFCLAEKDPDGNPTTGINRVDGSSVSGYVSEGMRMSGSSCGASEHEIKDLSRWPTDDYYNLWFVHDLCPFSTIYGFASYPTGGNYDGAVAVAISSTATAGVIMAHEMGHGFNLYHTFDNTSSCSSESDCSTQGDRCCDTPPHTTYDCQNSQNYCNANEFESSTFNIMSYCNMDIFTPDQKTRLEACLNSSPRLSLLSSPASCAPTPTSGINNINSETTLNVFPNPVIDNATQVVYSSGKEELIELLLTDVMGRLLRQHSQHVKSGQNRINLNIDNLSKGIYLLTLYNNNSNPETIRIIK